MNKLIALIPFLILALLGCGSGSESYENAPKSDVAGPGKDAMKQWADQNPNNGQPGHENDAPAASAAPGAAAVPRDDK